MANRYLKSCSVSLFIREMQIKTTQRYHFRPVSMAKKEKKRKEKEAKSIRQQCWQGCGEIGTLMYCWCK